MKANEARLLDLLKKSTQFTIPIFQRTYSWTERECRQLWDDIIHTGSSDDLSAHFVGSIVYVEERPYQVSNQPPLLVIDGQQRLTTIALILAAMSRTLQKLPEEQREPVDGFSPEKIDHYYLRNPLEKGDRRYKLLLTQTDRASLLAILDGAVKPKDHSIRIEQNFALFQEWVSALHGKLVVLCRGLAKLMVVDVALSRGQDNPQLIFESMNSTGRELTQADLIRNFVLMGLSPDLQSKLYEQHWRPMELEFGQEAYGTHFDYYMRHYLTVKTGEIPNIRQVYEAFKTHSCDPAVARGGVENLVADLRRFAGYYCRMALRAEPDKRLKEAFDDLRELRVEVAFPLLLELYDDYTNRKLSREDLFEAARLIEAYVFRRAICDIPPSSLNKTFATFSRFIKKDRYLESIRAHFLSLPSYRRFPTDQEFQERLESRNLYHFPRRSYWLRRIENFQRKEPVPVDQYTVEHILPQNPDLSADWQRALGRDWQRVQQTWLHTLGNLTLTGYNSEYSDRPFSEKRDMPGGFRHSPLQLNQGLGELHEWNEEAIQDRARRLSSLAIKVWAAPELPPEAVQRYKIKPVTAQRPLEHYTHLKAGPLRELFDALRAQVLALDPCVVEERYRAIIAYRAESTFVDVLPQKTRLRLTLKLPLAEARDPLGLCKDLGSAGHWGVGDVEVRLTTIDQLPNVMALIRQALDRQLGNGEPE